jgi:hypothetical protein
VLDGIDKDYIQKVLSNIIAQEPDEDLRRLKNVQKDAVVAISEGTNPRIVAALLNSHTDIPCNEDPGFRLAGKYFPWMETAGEL